MNRTDKILDAVGFAADVMGIGFMFGDLLGNDNGRNPQLDAISGQLDDIKGLVEQSLLSEIDVALGKARGALDLVQSARDASLAESETAVRAVLVADANRDARAALNELQSITGRITSDQFTVDDIAYMITSLGYAISVRQVVAQSLGNGALGDAGLHAQIKAAYDALFERQSDTGLIDVLEEKIRAEVDATYRFFDISSATEVTADLVWAPPGVNQFGPLPGQPDERMTQTITVERAPGSTPLFEVVQGRFGPEVVFLGNYETDASFRVRYTSAVEEATARITDDAMVSLGMYTMIDALEAETVHLADNSNDASSIHEIRLARGEEDRQATNLADYVIGNDDDNRIEGLGGPDALVGGRGNDVLIGGNWTDALTGGPGSDMLFGATPGQTNTAIDTANFDGNSRDYTIEGGRTYATVTHSDGTRDKLFDIDVVRFDDGFIELGEGNALDGAGDIADFTIPEIVALLYAAALDRSNTDDDQTNNLDRAGLNFYIDGMENGLSVVALAEDLMTSPEFTENFGDVTTLSNEAFVDRVYQNVLDRPPEPEGRDFYIAELSQNGQTKAQVLADIAISPENALEAQPTLMSLYETSTPEVRVLPDISIDLDWVFVA